MRTLIALLLCVLSWSLPARAAQAVAGKFVVDVPDQWHVVTDGPDSFYASPKKERGLPELTVQTCERTESGCSTPCEREKIRREYLDIAADFGRLDYSEQRRSDGSTVYGASVSFVDKDGVTQIVLSVICSQRGIAYLGLLSKEPRETVKRQFELMVSTARWR